MTTENIQLFPLSSVLFPGGFLSLRIFEQRYLDLVRDCARSNSGFGVCLILDGREAGEPAVPAAMGTLARITDFHTLSDGLLGIHAEGHERFRVLETRVRNNGAIFAEVEYLRDEPSVAMPVEHTLLATILERLHESVGGEFAKIDRARYDDAAWVSFRLAEGLPLEKSERQRLLQLEDPVDRLQQLTHYLPRFQPD